MSQRYPSSVVWLIECRSNGQPLDHDKPMASGSGVAIWIKKRGDGDAGKRYILTCQHVVREGRTGKLLDNIRVWRPGTGYTNPTAALKARISSIRPLTETWPKESQIPADDWVLLEVEDEDFSQSADCARTLTSPSIFWNSLVGYPGGATGLIEGNLLEPLTSRGFRRIPVLDATIQLLGPEEAAEGMSGGGLFTFLGAFAGLHRSTMQKGIVKRSVSAGHIRSQLRAKGYDIVEPGALPVPIRFAMKLVCLLTIVATFLGFETGRVGNPCDSNSLLGRLQRSYSSLNIHILNRHLNGTVSKLDSFTDRVRCYQTVTLSGDIQITRKILVERGGVLRVSKGASMQFSEDSGVECYGCLQVTGEEDAVVTMKGIGSNPWPGLFLAGPDSKNSSLSYCNISNGAGTPVTFTQDAHKSMEIEDEVSEKRAESFVPPPLQYGGDDRKAFGGAICFYDTSDLSLDHCGFYSNCSESGGAVHLYRVDRCVFDECVFENNRAIPMWSKTAKPPGGAMSLQHCSSVTVRGCAFRGNAALGRFSCGGAVFVGFRTSIDFTGQTSFVENVASNVGGAVYFLSMRPTVSGAEVNEASGFSRKSLITDCTFRNNRSLLSLGAPNAPWAQHGHAVAVDAGCNVVINQSTFTQTFLGGRCVHVDVGDDQAEKGDIHDNSASLVVSDCSFEVADIQSSKIDVFASSKNRVSLKQSNCTTTEVPEESVTGLAGLADHLMPNEQVVSGRKQRYQRERKAGVQVDTVVIHHVSAIKWDDDKTLDAAIKVRAESQLPQGENGKNPLSPILCRAIFESYGVSAHYLITREGEIWRLVPHSAVAFHAGESVMPNPPDKGMRENVNEFSLGIELVAVHPSEYGRFPDPQDRAYTEAQYSSLRDLLGYLSRQFVTRGESTLTMLVGHDEIAGESVVKSGRRSGPPKTDPGPDFEWSRFRNDDFSPIIEGSVHDGK